jgi:hypothetical protein
MQNLKLYVILGLAFLTSFVLAASFVTSYNYGNRMDNSIKAQYEQMENVLSQYSQRIQELVQVPSMYKDDLKEVVTASMQGRYGKNGSKAVFSFIKEHNIKFDSSLYKTVMQNIEGGRKDFEFEQKKLIDIKNEYNIAIGSLYTGTWLRIAGFPKIDLDKYHIISNTATKEVFKNGVETGPIKLR